MVVDYIVDYIIDSKTPQAGGPKSPSLSSTELSERAGGPERGETSREQETFRGSLLESLMR